MILILVVVRILRAESLPIAIGRQPAMLLAGRRMAMITPRHRRD